MISDCFGISSGCNIAVHTNAHTSFFEAFCQAIFNCLAVIHMQRFIVESESAMHCMLLLQSLKEVLTKRNEAHNGFFLSTVYVQFISIKMSNSHVPF